ncbi:MAG: FAD-dependent oxidoreductase [Spirochaetes bacterium]|nr:FAD-dependent oxidoreductase [Spirochaetota bacterium]
MKHFDLLIIGGVAAGMSAASQARRYNENISIGVFEKSDFISYGACGMPYLISNLITDYKKLLAVDKNKYINERNIQIFTNSEVTEVNFKEKNVSVKHADSLEKYSYDKLVIATGAKAVIPPIKGMDSEKVYTLRNLDDGLEIKKYLELVKPEKGVIIGGGAIGLEMAESLRALDIETIILEKMDIIAAAFSEEVRKTITDELIRNNVSIITGADIQEIAEKENGMQIQYNGHIIDTDFIIASIGVRPNTDFLKNTGLNMTGRGAIIINEKSETNIENVYAAGDCCTVRNLITKDDVYMPLGTTSNKQGRVAGLQAAGINSERFKGVVGTQFVKVFDLEIAKTGLSEKEAAEHGINTDSAEVYRRSKAGYYPNAEKIFIKIIINKDDRTIIGGEAAGKDGAAQRVNILAAAITAGMNIEDFAYMDLGYAPPFSPVWDSLLAGAQKLLIRN